MLKRFPTNPVKSTKTANPEVSRLLSAAVISRSFRSALLSDPAKAIASGYFGEQFKMSDKETRQVKSIHACSLADFAVQLAGQ